MAKQSEFGAEEEQAQRRDEALRRALAMPPKHRRSSERIKKEADREKNHGKPSSR